MNPSAVPLLFRLIEMGTRSLLQYTSESVPWAGDKRRDAIAAIFQAAEEERDEVARLTCILQKKRIRLPVPSSYPSHFTTSNFVSVDYLLPRLIAEHDKEIAEIERHLALIDDEEIRKLAEDYLAMKRRHLDTLRQFTLAPV